MPSLHGTVAGAGVGLRLPHLAEVVATRPAAGWFEIHPETFMANPHAIELLLQVAERYPISVHTVGVSIGSAHGVDVDAHAYLDAMPSAAIRELHLGGFTAEDDEASPGGTVLVDTHGTHVSDAAWDLYVHAIERFGRRPTLIEWDNDIPSLDTLLAEARRADEIAARTETGSRHAAAG